MDDIDKMVEELEEIAQYEGTEVGETWSALCSLVRHDGLSDEFKKALEKEIKGQWEFMKANCRIVEMDNVIKHTYREVEWFNE